MIEESFRNWFAELIFFVANSPIYIEINEELSEAYYIRVKEIDELMRYIKV